MSGFSDAARFEWFVATRYLMAKRKQAVISIITVISIIGVAAGVMALIIALAINNGFRGTLQRTLLGATAHVAILEKEPSFGISNWREISQKVSKLPHVESAAPTLYGSVFMTRGPQAKFSILKGLDLDSEVHRTTLTRNLKEGSLDELRKSSPLPGVILGKGLAQGLGARVGDRLTVISPQGTMSPYGMRPAYYDFQVAGIFESGFFELDAAWAFTTLQSVQRVLSLDDVANAIELKVEPVDSSDQVAREAEKVVGNTLAATTWMEQNRQILNALRMERVVTVITIGLIQMVAALNILISLIMMVMEKNRDIALLVSMGAKRSQIRRIFLYQGALIGVVGAVVGLILGYGISYFANEGRWIRLDEQVYALSFVPFEPRWIDALWVGGGALLVSLLATIYPARNAAAILPAEALRYE